MLKKYYQQFSLDSLIRILTGLFLFLLPWQTILIIKEQYLNGVKWEYGIMGYYGTEILLWVIIFMFMYWYWKKSKLQRTETKVRMTGDRLFIFSCLVFIVYTMLSGFWAIDSELARQHALRIMEMFFLFLIIYLGPLNFLQSAKWFIFGAIPVALLGIGQFLLQTTFVNKWFGLVYHPVWEAGTSIVASDSIGRWLRSYGSFSHPNVFGGYLVVVIVLLLYLSAGRQDCSIVKIDNVKKVFSSSLFPVSSAGGFILYSLFFTALFLTFSRSALIVLFISILVYWIIVLKIKYSLYLISYLTLLFIILTTILFPILSSRVPSSSYSEKQSVTERVFGYSDAWQVFKQNAWFGVGAGNYTLTVFEMDKTRSGWSYQPVHNTVFLFATELGIIGIILIIFVIISFIRYQISDSKYLFNYKYLLFGCYLLSVICYLLLTMFDHYLYSSYIGLMMTAVLLSLWSKFNVKSLHS